MNHNLTTTVVDDSSVRWIESFWSDERPSRGTAHATVMSFPFDYCVSHRPGTRHGPAKIIELLNGYSAYCTDRRTDFSGLALVDGGNVPALNNIARYYENVRQAVRELGPETVLIGLGGDHSVSDPIYRGQVDRTGGPVGLIVLDAHFDSRPPVSEREHSGHWMYTLSDVIDYEASAQLGLNASIYAAHYMEIAERNGIMIRTLSEARSGNVASLADEAIQHVLRKTERFHLSIDIDAIDSAFCPGTSVPNPCGFLPHEVLDIAFRAALHPGFAGCDIMEVSPPLDTDDRTSHVAAQIILHVLAGVAQCEARQADEVQAGRPDGAIPILP